MPVADGIFFSQNNEVNQGTFYTWTEEEAISAMETAEQKAGQINSEGQKLAEKMTYAKTTESILSFI